MSLKYEPSSEPQGYLLPRVAVVGRQAVLEQVGGAPLPVYLIWGEGFREKTAFISDREETRTTE